MNFSPLCACVGEECKDICPPHNNSNRLPPVRHQTTTDLRDLSPVRQTEVIVAEERLPNVYEMDNGRLPPVPKTSSRNSEGRLPPVPKTSSMGSMSPEGRLPPVPKTSSMSPGMSSMSPEGRLPPVPKTFARSSSMSPVSSSVDLMRSPSYSTPVRLSTSPVSSSVTPVLPRSPPSSSATLSQIFA